MKRFDISQVTAHKLNNALERDGAAILSGLDCPKAAAFFSTGILDGNVLPQPHGGWFTKVWPKPRYPQAAPGSPSADLGAAVQPHTDGHVTEFPPFAIGHYHPPQETDPEPLGVCSLVDFLENVCTPQEMEWLAASHQKWGHVFGTGEKEPLEAPVYQFVRGQALFRWSTHFLLNPAPAPDPLGRDKVSVPWSEMPETGEMAIRLVQKLEEFAADPANCRRVDAEPGDLVLIENHRHVHFRGPVDRRDRYFVRFWLG